MSIAATVSTSDPLSYKSGSHKTGSYGSSKKGSPDYEPEEIQDIRRLVYENPNLGSFGPWTFQEFEHGEAEAQHVLDFLASENRRYKFVFPEQADMYLSALAFMFFQTKCEEYFKTNKSWSAEAMGQEARKTKKYYNLPVHSRPLTCKQKIEKFHAIFHKIRNGMINTASKQGGGNIEGRVDEIIRRATGGNLDEQFSEIKKYNFGGRRRRGRKTRRGRKGSRKHRKSTRKH